MQIRGKVGRYKLAITGTRKQTRSISDLLASIQLRQTVPHAGVREVVFHIPPDILGCLLLVHIACDILDFGCSSAAYPVKISKHVGYLRSVNLLVDEEAEAFTILNRLGASLTLMRRHGVSRVANNHGSTFDVGRQRVLVAQLPQLNIFCLSLSFKCQ